MQLLYRIFLHSTVDWILQEKNFNLCIETTILETFFSEIGFQLLYDLLEISFVFIVVQHIIMLPRVLLMIYLFLILNTETNLRISKNNNFIIDLEPFFDCRYREDVINQQELLQIFWQSFLEFSRSA